MKKSLFLFLFISIFQGALFSQSFRDQQFAQEFNYPLDFVSYYKDLVFESQAPIFDDSSLLKPLVVSFFLSDLMKDSNSNSDLTLNPLVYLLELKPEDKLTPLAIFQKGLAYFESFKGKENLTRVEEENLEDFIYSFFGACGCGYNDDLEGQIYFFDSLTQDQINKLLGFKYSD